MSAEPQRGCGAVKLGSLKKKNKSNNKSTFQTPPFSGVPDLDGVMTSREGSDSALSRQVQVGTLPGLVAEWTLCGWRQANGQKSLVTCLHPW